MAPLSGTRQTVEVGTFYTTSLVSLVAEKQDGGVVSRDKEERIGEIRRDDDGDDDDADADDTSLPSPAYTSTLTTGHYTHPTTTTDISTTHHMATDPASPSTYLPQSTDRIMSPPVSTMTGSASAQAINPLPSGTQAQKGFDNSGDSTLPLATTSQTENEPTASGSSGDDYHHDDHHGPPPNPGDTAGRALIAIGAIGSLISLCFILWIVYRAVKRPRQGRRGFFKGGILAKLPWRRGGGGGGDAVGGNTFMAQNLQPKSEEFGKNSMEKASIYEDDIKLPGSILDIPKRSSIVDSQNTSMPPQAAVVSALVLPADQIDAFSQGDTSGVRTMTAEEYAAFTQYRSSIGGIRRSQISDSNSGLEQSMRPPLSVYDPARREVYRASELSSLSSGFGDADIIIADILAKPPPAMSTPRQSSNYIGRFSWISKKLGDRQTVNMAGNEDRPSRYRTITSWVNQQTRRMKKPEDRPEMESDVPPVPTLPAGFN